MFYILHIKPIILQLHPSPMNRIMSIANDINVDLFNLNSIESFNNFVNRIFYT